LFVLQASAERTARKEMTLFTLIVWDVTSNALVLSYSPMAALFLAGGRGHAHLRTGIAIENITKRW
jgi:hypothetical protein